MNRSRFIRNAVMTAGGLAMFPQVIKAETSRSPIDQIPAEKVKEFLGAGHNNLPKVKLMLEEFPGLIYAAWDLGGGDFETALEGAGHVGDKEIANYLINKGARTNLFVLTMLGKIEIVKPYLEAFPEYLTARGPHGFTLLHHAQRGKEDAAPLVEYLQSRGLKEPRMPL